MMLPEGFENIIGLCQLPCLVDVLLRAVSNTVFGGSIGKVAKWFLNHFNRHLLQFFAKLDF